MIKDKEEKQSNGLCKSQEKAEQMVFVHILALRKPN
jgi:hypothetical protein